MNYSESSTRLFAASLGILFLTAGIHHAGGGDQTAKLLPDDGSSGDLFGASVSIDGAVAIVGSERHDGIKVDSGIAYLLDATSGMQFATLQPEDGEFSFELFGQSVAIRGNRAIVGATGYSSVPIGGTFKPATGAAYLFDTNTGLQLARLLPDDLFKVTGFGVTVAIAEGRAIVGARTANGSTAAAYLFDTSTGAQIAKLQPADLVGMDSFGRSVSLSGSTAIVGAPTSNDNGFGSGSAYIFDASTGLQLGKLSPNDPAPNTFFGAVAICGTTAIVGAPGAGDNGQSPGCAYLFDTTTGTQLAKLLADDGAAGDGFGGAVAINDQTVAISAGGNSGNGLNSGSVYIFDTSTGKQVHKLLPSDGTAQDRFGASIAVSGPTTIVGANRDSVNGIDSGASYLFQSLSMLTDTESLSISTGGQQQLSLESGVDRAGWFYIVLGSATGTSPGIDFGGGVALPLNIDAYFNLTLTRPNANAFGNFVGVLDSAGDAQASFTLPLSLDPGLAGLKLNHAFLAASTFGIPEFASNSVRVTLVP